MGAPPYKQVPLSSPNFAKQCICPEGGPDGTKRCRNRCFCDLRGNADLAEEAEQLEAELLDDWQDLNHDQQRAKARRLAQLRICTKEEGRSVEVGDKILSQRREEEDEQELRTGILTTPSRHLRHSKARASMRPHVAAAKTAEPATPAKHTLAAFLQQQHSPPVLEQKSKIAPPRGKQQTFPPPPSSTASTASSHTMRATSGTPVSVTERVKQLEANVQTLRARLADSERETNKWFRRYQRLKTIFDRGMRDIEEDDKEDGDESESTDGE